VQGHEGCGEVVSVGPQVIEFAPGDMVSILAVPGCRQPLCAECSKGVPQVCVDGPHYGLDRDGSFAPYVAVKAVAALKLPKDVSAAAGAVATDAITTAYHAVVGRAQVKAGETVLLYGLGGLGFNALQILLSLGARVIAVDQRQTVLDEAVKLGVRSEDAVPPGTTNVAEWIAEKQLLIDKAVDFVGVSESLGTTVQTGMFPIGIPSNRTSALTLRLVTVRLGGKIVLVGMIGESLVLQSRAAIMKHLDILCSMGGTLEDLRASLDLIVKGIITPRVEMDSLANLPQVLKNLHEGKIKSRMALIPEGVEDMVGLVKRNQ
jgi:alcohol dehydrogenase, propanol-preferring